MNLVVGSTGVLGAEICRLLSTSGKKVRALVRSGSSAVKKQVLLEMGAELTEGDLKDAASLERACENVEVVLSTATSIVSRQEGDSLFASDRDGHFNLIQAARKQGVRRFVFISFPPIPFEFPLQSSKRAVENKLKESELVYTILQPSYFQEAWLGTHLGFDPVGGKVKIYGSGEKKISWISFRDVAQYSVGSLDIPDFENAVSPLGGPDDLTPMEVVRIAEDVARRKMDIEFVPEESLKAQFDSATDETQKTFAGLMLGYASGSVVDTSTVLQKLQVRQQSVRQYVESLFPSPIPAK